MPNAISWKEKAAALRAAAEHAVDQVTRQSLLLLAEDCDAFADEESAASAEALAASRPHQPTNAAGDGR